MLHFVLSALAVVVAASPTLSHASTWQIDSAHTSAQFAVRHLMVSTVRGTMGKTTGVVTLDETDPTKSSVEAVVDVAGIDTREPKRDEHLKGADFFDVGKYPTVNFKSKKVTKVSDSKFQVTGDLMMHGVTKEIVLDVEGSPTPLKDPYGNTKLGGVATTKLNRKDFGIVWNSAMDGGGVVVGDSVDVTIDIELTKEQ
jgi:polyisoprenoid-binding protein YceI